MGSEDAIQRFGASNGGCRYGIARAQNGARASWRPALIVILSKADRFVGKPLPVANLENARRRACPTSTWWQWGRTTIAPLFRGDRSRRFASRQRGQAQFYPGAHRQS